MEALQSLALKQEFINERNKIDKNEIKRFGPGFSFHHARFNFKQWYNEDEQSKILRHLCGDLELCCCGAIFETEDRNAYQNYRWENHFKTEHHRKFMMDNEYCTDC